MPSTELFSTAEARAFDGARLASETDYPDVIVTAKEAEIRSWLERACGVNFIPTVHSSEVHDGDDSNYLILNWPRITAVASIYVDGVALTAAEINLTDYDEGLAVDPVLPMITRRSGIFASGWSNVLITYTAGYVTVPDLVKRAALMIAVQEIPANNMPFQADGFDDGGTSYSFARADGYGGNWSSIPQVMAAICMYSYKGPGIA